MASLEPVSPPSTALAGSVSLPSVVPPAPVQSPDDWPEAAVTIYPFDLGERVVVPFSARTHEGFRNWALSEKFPDRGKITFVQGEIIVDMSPESFEEHGAVKVEICRVLSQLARGRSLGHFRIDRTLVLNEQAGVSNEPDALLLSRETIKAGRAAFIPEVDRPQSSKAIVGAVDWVLEIVSPSSRRKDAQLLRQAYFRASIPEYWLVDVLGEEIDFQILVPGDAGYQSAPPHDGWITSPTFGASFRLVRERDEDGYWQYTLEMQ